MAGPKKYKKTLLADKTRFGKWLYLAPKTAIKELAAQSGVSIVYLHTLGHSSLTSAGSAKGRLDTIYRITVAANAIRAQHGLCELLPRMDMVDFVRPHDPAYRDRPLGDVKAL